MTSELLKAEVTPQVPGSDLELNGKKYRITYPMSAVLRYKQKTGDNLFNPSHVLKIDEDPELLIAVLWAGLQEHQPETKYEDVEAMVNVGTSYLINKAITQALISYLPPKLKEAAEATASQVADPNAVSPQATTTV